MRIAWLLVLGASCGGDEDLTCELLAQPTNCWAKAAAELAACLPPNTMTGTFAADRRSCDFPNGARVTFDTALATDTSELEGFGFTLTRNDQMCGKFVDTFSNRMELTASGGTIVSELHAGGEFHLHCGDTTYASSFDALFECFPDGPPPTDGFDVTPTTVEFTISSVATPSPLFRCAQ